jgi:ABC-type molybdate transport system permease subunit
VEQIAQLLPESIRDYVLVVPFVFTVLICITTGAWLHRAHFFPSERIPLVLAPWGSGWYAVIAWGMNNDYQAKMWPQNLAVGFLIGFAATGIHQMIENSPLLSKFPILRLLVPQEPETKPTEEPKP